MEVNSYVPLELTLPKLASPDDHIVSRREVSIHPRESTKFGQQTGTRISDSVADRLTFYISDSNGFLDGMNSFITSEFEAYIQSSGGNRDIDGFIDNGGIHSCIKSIIIKCGSTVLERVESYSKLYNVLKFASVGKDHLNSTEFLALDDTADYKEVVGDYNFGAAVSDVAAIAGTTHTIANTGVITGTGTAYLTDLKVGDQILFKVSNATETFTHTGFITAIASDTSATVSPAPVNGNTTPAASLLYKVNKFDKYERRSIRNLAVNGVHLNNSSNKIRVMFKPMLRSLQGLKYIPLFLLPAPLEIQIEFNPARLVLVKNATSATSTDEFGYALSKPRFIASIVECQSDVMNSWLKAWENQGIDLAYDTFRMFSNRMNASETAGAFTLQANLASAKVALTIMHPESGTEADNTAAMIVKSQSTFAKDTLQRYRYSSGSEKYPSYNDVYVDDFLAAEAFAQLQLSMNHMNGTLYGTCMDANNWANGNYSMQASNVLAYSANKFIMAAPLSKYLGSFQTGADLSKNPLQLDIGCSSGLSAAHIIRSWILHDAVLSISRANGVINNS